MGFFIQDMRLLINIVNEYDQYHQRLIKENANLDCTKLLGMIVYKNFFPRDFAKLHRREGMVFKVMQLKDTFISFAQTDIIKREKNIDDLLEFSKRDSHLKIQELRKFFMEQLCSQIRNTVHSITIDSNSYSPIDIANNDNLFNALIKQKRVSYHYSTAYYSNEAVDIDVQALYTSTGFERRIKALELNQDPDRFAEIKQGLLSEKLAISSMKIKELFKNYPLEDIKEYLSIELPDLIDIFIRRGYIDEDYYDYISYFYEGMISISDRDTLIDIKRQRKGDYLKHIDHIENFVKELKPYNFTSDSILYVELLDYLVSASTDNLKDYLSLFYKRINKKTAPLKFLVVYYLKGKYPDTVFSQFIANNRQSTWQQILKHSDESERQSLLCAWLRYAKYPLIKDAQVWINKNYGFVEKNAEELSEGIIEKICEDALFEELNLGSQLVLGKVIDLNSYAINIHNLSVVISHLTQTAVDENKIILSEIIATQNSKFIEYIQSNIKDAFDTFSTSRKDENEDALKWLINNDELDDSQLDKYLNGQINLLQSFQDVPQGRWKLVLKNYILQPSWESLQEYYTFTGEFDDVILRYIEKYSDQLGEQSFGSNGNTESVFFGEIFKSKNISFNSIKLLTPVFIENSYDGDEELPNLDTDRLEWLLEHEMLLFSEGNSTVLKDTEIFSKYLAKYKDDFLQSISESYLSNPKVIISLMKNAQFSNSEHYLIVGNIPHSIIFGNRQVADIVVAHLAGYRETDKGASFYISLLGASSTNESAIRLATKAIREEDVEISDCNQILAALGDTYSDLTDSSKNPKFEATQCNKDLLEAAKGRGIITSYKPYKENQLRAYHGRK